MQEPGLNESARGCLESLPNGIVLKQSIDFKCCDQSLIAINYLFLQRTENFYIGIALGTQFGGKQELPDFTKLLLQSPFHKNEKTSAVQDQGIKGENQWKLWRSKSPLTLTTLLVTAAVSQTGKDVYGTI